ncbi:MAG: type III-A CRISPR-associated protein Csm2 [bacterium]|nr:type III-A CRISPR-associated protein Csm2 [bacterium]
MNIPQQQPRQGGGGQGGNRPGGGQPQNRTQELNRNQFINLEDTSNEANIRMVKSAETWGKQWHEVKLTSAQLRKFYHEVVAIYQIAKNEMENEKQNNAISDNEAKNRGYDKVCLQFKLLKAKAAYGLRDRTRIESMKDLVNFVQWATEDVKNYDTLERFKLYFEACVGFYYGFGEIRSN